MAKVLVIDDDSMNLKMAEFALKKGGHEVLKATSGAEGIDLIKSDSPDVVLLDVEMPVMGGFETLSKIREDASIKDVKVAFVTGTVDEETEAKGKELGAIGIVKKPFFAPDLLGVIANA